MRKIAERSRQCERRQRAHRRLRKRIQGTPERPRLAVYKSLRYIYAQVIDDLNGRTLAQASSAERGPQARASKGDRQRRVRRRQAVGEAIAERAKAKGVEQVVFDRGGAIYHGKVKAVADGARAKGPSRSSEGRVNGSSRSRRLRIARLRVLRAGGSHQPRDQGGQGRQELLLLRPGGGRRRQRPGRLRHRQGQGGAGPRSARGSTSPRRTWCGCPSTGRRFRTRSSACSAPAGCCSSRPPPGTGVIAGGAGARGDRVLPASRTS